MILGISPLSSPRKANELVGLIDDHIMICGQLVKVIHYFKESSSKQVYVDQRLEMGCADKDEDYGNPVFIYGA